MDPGSGRSLREGNGSPPPVLPGEYPWADKYGGPNSRVAKNWTRLRDFHRIMKEIKPFMNVLLYNNYIYLVAMYLSFKENLLNWSILHITLECQGTDLDLRL